MTAISNCTSGLLVQLISKKQKGLISFKILIHAVRVFDDEEANNTTWNSILCKNASEFHSAIDRCFYVRQQI